MTIETFQQPGAERTYTLAEVLEAYEAGRTAGATAARLPPVIPDQSQTIGRIQAVVAEVFVFPVGEMKSNRRARIVARPRQIAMYLSRELTPYSLPMIGRYFGNRDHTTVAHAIKKVEQLSQANPLFGDTVASLKERLLAELRLAA